MGVLISITASEDIQLDEIDIASQMIHEEAHPDANIIWGATFDPTLQDEMRITIIATGFVSDYEGANSRISSAARVAPRVVEAPAAPAERPAFTVEAPAAPVEEIAQPSVVDVTPESVSYNPVKRTVVEAKQINSAASANEEYESFFTFITNKNKRP
jgi:hypothetical protein